MQLGAAKREVDARGFVLVANLFLPEAPPEKRRSQRVEKNQKSLLAKLR